MEVVILCGGKGTRLREETEYKPKPMVEIGGKPMLLHVMELYAKYGFKKFILALGYKGDQIRELFLNYLNMKHDISVDLVSGSTLMHRDNVEYDWKITMVDTGTETLKGARLKRVSKYIEGTRFMVTYGDGVGNIDIKRLVRFHVNKEKVGTFTGVHMPSRFGTVQMSQKGEILGWQEKPVIEEFVSGGFFVFERRFLDYLTEDETCELEAQPLERLAKEQQLSMYPHDGYWYCMDTYRDYVDLNELWETNGGKWEP